jgi:bifunctional ADP-heptose synthase (sugar kinase/adenylyltransferase)
VDYVTIFLDRTAEQLATLVRPEVYVKGADYASAPERGDGQGGDTGDLSAIDEGRLPEAKVVRAGGGRVVLLPLVPDRSSSTLAARIQEAAR